MSDKLSCDCLLSLWDDKDLSEFADAFIPQVKMVTGPDLIQETDVMDVSGIDAVSVLPLYQCLGRPTADLSSHMGDDVMDVKIAPQMEIDRKSTSVDVWTILHHFDAQCCFFVFNSACGRSAWHFCAWG